MSRKMLVDAVHPEETRVVITDKKSSILEFDFTTAAKPQVKGNVYLAKVTRVEPSLQAAFVEYGGGKQGFLPFSEIHPNYYQIPTSDRQRLIEEEEEAAKIDAEEEEEAELDDEAFDDDELSPSAIAEKAADKDNVKSEEITEESDASTDDEEDEEEKPRKSKKTRGRKSKEKEEAEAEENAEENPTNAETSEETDSESDQENNDDETNDDDANSKKARSRGRRRRGGRNRNRRGRGRRDETESGDVETISGEDEIERPRRKREYTRRYKIQEVIKRNQVLLVQVIKEERGNKGVSLTTFLSLAGRYCVLMPNSPRGGGVSRKIGSNDDRKRLKKVLNDLALPNGMSVIIRTAGAGHTRAEIKRDFDYLVKLWNQIREDTLSSSAPALVYEESNIIQRCIRDSYNNDIEEILVDGEEAFKETKAFMRRLIPSHAPRVKQHKSDKPLFYKAGIDDQLMSMTEPEVHLPSGGSIVMMPTEALISIDVNSGRSTRERNVEETAVKTNIEAAKEVARQLRLRDLAGLVVIDFIDMMEGKNRRAVERAMKEALRHDRAKIQVGRISTFGLMEMSRQRMRPSISESINRSCPHCQGTGVIRSEAALSMQIIRAIEKEVSTGGFDRFRVSVTASEAVYILNNMRDEIDKIEQNFDCSVEILIDGALHEGDFRIEKLRRKGGKKATQQRSERPTRGRRGGKGRKHKEDNPELQDDKAPATEAQADAEGETPEADSVEADSDAANAEEKPKKARVKKASTTKKTAKTPRKKATKKDSDESDAPEAEAEEKPKKRGRPRKKKEEAEPQAEAADEPVAANDASTEQAPKVPKRSGWWQKIVD